MKIHVLNGCSHSKLSVNPKNWETKSAKTNLDWFITYRFYDPSFPKPKLVMLKGMNSYKSLADRQIETIRLIKQELESLADGYNPFQKKTLAASTDEKRTIIEALNYAFTKTVVADLTRRDIKYSITQFDKAITVLGLEQMSISEVTRKHVKLILDESSSSNDRFNKNRSGLMILFSILTELEMVNTNFVRDVKRKKTVKKIRQILTPAERVIVDNHLKVNHPEFHRFLHIFFHSGARISELIRLKVQEVDLSNQRFKVTILKGRQYVETWKTIKDVALPYWDEVLKSSTINQYVFSRGLVPGDVCIKPYQIDKRWNRLVKKKLNIEADFYSLKHLHTTEVVELLDDVQAAKHNSHTNTAMVNSVYDVRATGRKANQVKTLNNSFT
jgi:integrase